MWRAGAERSWHHPAEFWGVVIPRMRSALSLTSVAASVQLIDPVPARSGPCASEVSPPSPFRAGPAFQRTRVATGFVYFTLTPESPQEPGSSLYPPPSRARAVELAQRQQRSGTGGG